MKGDQVRQSGRPAVSGTIKALSHVDLLFYISSPAHRNVYLPLRGTWTRHLLDFCFVIVAIRVRYACRELA